ncbi:MAG: xylose isomerase [Candidatus Omnitrophota bacterium]|jgi:inosose dehydratase|nr:MAG: xylose isomerase [Candidatus Omnitrophota bacterium]
MSKIKIANAPCSWGVLEFDLEGQTAGYAQVLDEMVQAGYEGTEFGDWGFMPTDPVELRQEIKRRNLTLLAAFVPVALANPAAHRQGIDVAVKTAKLLAAVDDSPFIVLADDNGSVETRTKNAGRIRPEQGLNGSQWKIYAQGAENLARTVLNEVGVRTVFHHHCAGYVETPAEVECLLNETDSDLLGLCFDAGHFEYGGGNAVEGLNHFSERIWHVHFKDCHPDVAAQARTNAWDYFEAVKNGVFCELGKGSVDFTAILKEIQKMNYEGWIVVEQDVLPGMGSPLESAKRNREFLQSLGL